MDTVPVGTLEKWKHDPFSATIEGDIVYGRGAADMKGGLAVYLGSAKRLTEKEDDLPVKVQFQFVVDEETGAASPYGTTLLVKKDTQETL